MYALIWRRRSVKPQQRSPKRREFLLNSALKQSSHNIDGGSSGREEYFIKRTYTILHKRRDENQNRVITFFVCECLEGQVVAWIILFGYYLWRLTPSSRSRLSMSILKHRRSRGKGKTTTMGPNFKWHLTSWEGMAWVKKRPRRYCMFYGECKFRRSRA